MLLYIGNLSRVFFRMANNSLVQHLIVLNFQHNGELAVREEFPDATIFRPADVFGLEDRFLRYYANNCK